jgi:hypothetical protein
LQDKLAKDKEEAIKESIRRCASFNHGSLATIYSAFEDEKFICCIFEFCPQVYNPNF